MITQQLLALADCAPGTYYSPAFEPPGDADFVRVFSHVTGTNTGGTVDVTLEDSFDDGAFQDGGAPLIAVAQQLASAGANMKAATATGFGRAVRAKLVVGTANMKVEVWAVAN
jgi:hypothetical protein